MLDGTDVEGCVHWTAKTRALVEAHERSVRAGAGRPDLEQAVAAIRKTLELRARHIERALTGADDLCRPLMRTVLQSLERPPETWLDDPADVDAARAVLSGVERNGSRNSEGGTTYFLDPYPDGEIEEAFLDLWSLRGGLPHAIERLARCHSYEVVLFNDGFRLDLSEKWGPRWCPHDGIWQKLRLRLIACPDVEYEASRQAAERIRATSSLALRCSIADAFPQEVAWAASDAARAVAGEAAGDRQARLLACLRDPVLAEGIARGSAARTSACW